MDRIQLVLPYNKILDSQGAAINYFGHPEVVQVHQVEGYPSAVADHAGLQSSKISSFYRIKICHIVR